MKDSSSIMQSVEDCFVIVLPISWRMCESMVFEVFAVEETSHAEEYEEERWRG